MSRVIVNVEEVESHATVSSPLPMRQLWNDTDLIPFRGRTLVLRAHCGSDLVGFWLVPLVVEQDGLAARRPCRLFPYAAPWVLPGKSLQRRRIVLELFSALQTRVSLIDLPMAPGFRDANATFSIGCFAEWRHTHIVNRDEFRGIDGFSASARGAIRHAQRNVQLKHLAGAEHFDFDRAIHAPAMEIQWRRRVAEAQLASGRGVILLAEYSGVTVGGALVVHDDRTAYLLHTWFDRSGPRGIPSVLVYEAMRWAFERPGLMQFDFEGSILAAVDEFMSSFGTTIESYAYIYWARDDRRLLSAILQSLAIPGRVTRLPGAYEPGSTLW